MKTVIIGGAAGGATKNVNNEIQGVISISNSLNENKEIVENERCGLLEKNSYYHCMLYYKTRD